MATTTQDLRTEIKKTADTAVNTAKSTVDNVQRDLTEAAGDVRDAAQKVFLAGLGALVVAEEEGSKTFKKLVKKGQKVELPGLGMERVKAIRAQIGGEADRAKEAVETRVQDAKYVATSSADKAEDKVTETVTTVMKRLGVPTRQEISELTASVDRLNAQIEGLKAQPSEELVMEAVGGGWYEIRIGDVVVEKVQGKEDAEAALVRVADARA